MQCSLSIFALSSCHGRRLALCSMLCLTLSLCTFPFPCLTNSVCSSMSCFTMSTLRDSMRVPQQVDVDSFPTAATRPAMVKFIHPANNTSVLSLAANDLVVAGIGGNPHLDWHSWHVGSSINPVFFPHLGIVAPLESPVLLGTFCFNPKNTTFTLMMMAYRGIPSTSIS